MDAEKQLVQTLEEFRDDLKQFIETRYEMLRSELSTSLAKLRVSAALVGTAALLGLLGVILLGVCLAFAISLFFGAFPNQVGVVYGFLITGFVSLLVAGGVGFAAKSKLKAEELAPNRTLRVLQRDQEVLKEGGQQDAERFRRRA
jgi:putative superfamily III holin-X